jgi:hypothetical protein
LALPLVALVAYACASSDGTRKELAWDWYLWNQGYIPLQEAGIVRLVEKDPGQPGKFRQTSAEGIPGSFKAVDALRVQSEAAQSGEAPPVQWNISADLARLGFEYETLSGQDEVARDLHGKVHLGLKVKGVGLSAEYDNSKGFSFKNVQHLRVLATDDRLLARCLSEFHSPGRHRDEVSFALVTDAYCADVDVSLADQGLSIKASLGEPTGFVPVELSGGRKATMAAIGCILGVRGAVLTATCQGVLGGTQEISPGEGTTVVTVGPDDVLEFRAGDGGRAWKPRWRDVPQAKLYDWRNGTLVDTDGTVESTSDPVALFLATPPVAGTFRIMAVEVSTGAEGLRVTSAKVYSGRSEELGSEWAKEWRARPPLTQVDRPSWANAIADPESIDEFIGEQEKALRLYVRQPDGPQIRNCSVFVACAPDPDTSHPHWHHRVRLVRYDLHEQAGRKFNYILETKGRTEGYEARAFGILKDKSVVPLGTDNQDNWFDSNTGGFAIQEGTEAIVVRVGNAVRTNGDKELTGLATPLRYSVKGVTWIAAFPESGVLGSACRFVSGKGQVIDWKDPAPQLVATGEALGEGWVRKFLKEALSDEEVSARIVADSMTRAERLRVFRYESKDPDDQMFWMLYRKE